MNEKKQKMSKLIDSFSVNGISGELWLMGGNGSLLIIISKIQRQGDRESRAIDKMLNSKAARMDNDEFTLQWEELKNQMTGDIQSLQRLEQSELFDEDELEKIGLASLN